MPLSAIALSVKPGGHIGSVDIGMDISTDGDGLTTVDLEGLVGRLTDRRREDHRQRCRRIGCADRRDCGSQPGRPDTGGPHARALLPGGSRPPKHDLPRRRRARGPVRGDGKTAHGGPGCSDGGPALTGPPVHDAFPGQAPAGGRQRRRGAIGELSGDQVLADLRSHGRRLVFDLDVDGFLAEEVAYLRGADVILMNGIGFGLSIGGQDLAAVNDWMRSNEVRTIIRTLAAAGAEIYDGAGVPTVTGYTVPVVDVTGAGDTFGGALVFALAESTDLRSAVEFAVAAASRAVTIEGPRGGVASSKQIEEFRRSLAGLVTERPHSIPERP